MENDILDDLFHGRIIPWEDGPKDDPELSGLLHRQAALSEQLAASITKEQDALLAQFRETGADIEILLNCHYFKKGFLLGAAFASRIRE